MNTRRRIENPTLTALVLAVLALLLPSCSTTTKTAGEVTWTAVKTTGKAVYQTGRYTGKGILYLAGRRVVPLEKEGNTYYVKVKVNKKQETRLVLDTGASLVQISPALARKAGINLSQGESIKVILADGGSKTARKIRLKEVRASWAKVKDVEAVVLEDDATTDSGGLLGMSFLGQFNFKVDTDDHLLVLWKK